ncbi:MAG: DedA family protein [Rikenellaceae bacterium]|nr:DedA family protein [Rikenellaceae bacterium]
MEALTDFFMQWGYWGMLLAAFLAGSVVPIGSEVVYVLLLKAGLDPLLTTLAATAGNTLGGMTCYWIGMLGKREWIHRWLGVSEEKLDKATRFLQGRGAWMGFFAFLPYLGEAIAVALGFMRSNQPVTALSMALGKAARYSALLLAFKGVISL